MERESMSEAREQADFYLRGREKSTLVAYNTEYKKHCVKFGWSWGLVWSRLGGRGGLVWSRLGGRGGLVAYQVMGL